MFSPPFVGVNGVNMAFLLPIHIYNIYLKSVLNTPKVGYSQWSKIEYSKLLALSDSSTFRWEYPITLSQVPIFGFSSHTGNTNNWYHIEHYQWTTTHVDLKIFKNGALMTTSTRPGSSDNSCSYLKLISY